MKHHHWLSLRLNPEKYMIYQNGHLRTIEAIGAGLVGVPRKVALPAVNQLHQLGTVSSHEEAHHIAVMLRFMNPA